MTQIFFRRRRRRPVVGRHFFAEHLEGRTLFTNMWPGLNAGSDLLDINGGGIPQARVPLNIGPADGGPTLDAITRLIVEDQLVVTTQPPSSIGGGVPFGLIVSAEDGNGNPDPSFSGTVILTLDPNPYGGTLSGAVSVAAVNGVARFSGLSVYQLGTYTLSAVATGLTGSKTAAVTVNPAPASVLMVNLPTSNVLTGAAFSVTVDATDPFGRVDPTYAGSITLSLLNSAGATLGGTLTVNAVSGVATFNPLTVNNPGAGYTIKATAASLSTSVSTAFAVYNVQFVVTTQPQDTVAANSGVGFGLVVAAQNAAGVTDASFDGTVTVSVLDSPGGSSDVFGGTTVTAINGVAVFSGLTIAQAGYYDLVVSGTGGGNATTNTFMVSADPATQLQVTIPPPTDVTATAPFEVDIAVEDAFGNVDTIFSGNVTIALPPGVASGTTLGGTLTVAAVDGIAAFPGLTVNQPASISGLQVSASSLASAATSPFVVTAVGTAAQLVITTAPPDTVTAGVPFGLVVTAEDDRGAVDTSFAGNVTLSEMSGATIGGTLTVAAVNGATTFTGLTLNQVTDNDELIATSAPLAAAMSGAITVNPAAAIQLSVSAPSNDVQPGAPFTIMVSASDSFGNTDTSYSGPITIALANSGNSLAGQLTETAVGGVATFAGLSIANAGTGLVISATGSVGSGMSPTFDVTNDVFVVTTPPVQSVETDEAFGFAVSAETVAGAVDASFNGPVTVALINLGTNSPILSGTLTVNAVSGIATFSGLSIDDAGAYLLSVTGSGIGGTATGEINVATAPAPSTTAITPSTASVPFGLPVIFTATVTSSSAGITPSGTVTFSDGATVLGTAQLQSNGTASLGIASLPSGANSITAIYGGDGADSASASSALTETVGLQSTAAPSLNGFVLPATAVAGQPIKAKLPVVIMNGGAPLTGNFSVVLLVDMSATLDGNQAQVGKMTDKLALKTGKSKAYKFALKSLPASLGAGTYHFFAEVIDPTGATDVGASGPLAVQAPSVTLSAIAGAVKPGIIKLNHVGVATITITDTGNINAAGLLDILLSPSTNGSTALAGIMLATSKKEIKLNDHKPTTVKLPFKVTSSLTAGNYESFFSVALAGASVTAVGPSFTAD